MWVPEIKEHCPGVPYILVGTNSGFRDDFPQHADEYSKKGWKCITKENGIEMMKKIGAKDYVECDHIKMYHLKEAFESAIKAALQYYDKIAEEKKKKEEEKKKDSKKRKEEKRKADEKMKKEEKKKKKEEEKRKKEEKMKKDDNKKSKRFFFW